MFKFFSQKTPLERAQDHIRQVTTASTLSHGGVPSAASPSGKTAAKQEHKRFCEECERKKNETFDRADAAAKHGDMAECNRLYKEDQKYDMDAINDGRRVLGIKLRS